MNDLRGGILPLSKDSRDFKLGQLVSFPKLSDLPDEFSLVLDSDIVVMDQITDGNDDFCSAYATCGMSALQEGVTLWPPFSFAASKSISGDPGAWGQNLRDALASHVKIGALAVSDVPEADKALEGKDKRYFDKYSDMAKTLAIAHQKEKYYFTKGPFDAYDNIRAALFMFAKEKRAVGIGVQFGWNLDSFILSGTPEGFGHMMYVYGWDKIGLKVVNSAGRQAGIDGFHRITRDAIEKYVKVYGAAMFIDLSSEEVQKRLIKKEFNLLQRAYQLLLSLFAKKVMEQPKEELKEEVKEEVKEEAKEEPYMDSGRGTETNQPEIRYDWSTPEKARHSVRLICDEEGLTVEQKNSLCATVGAESGWIPTAVNHNSNGTTDYGIAQINSYWWIGENKQFPSAEYVLANPEAVIRWMCTMWKANKRMLWVAYSSGAYKKYL